MKEAGIDKVWPHVPDMDVYSYRSEYCTQIYNTLARPVEKIPNNERYHCRTLFTLTLMPAGSAGIL